MTLPCIAPKVKRASKKLLVPIENRLLEERPDTRQWLVFGLDPSLSRTGYALALVTKGEDGVTSMQWLDVGSLKPETSSDPVWVRSKAIALALRTIMHKTLEAVASQINSADTGLVISMEAPTPGNDFLISISRILHVILLDWSDFEKRPDEVHVQLTNASTLRSLMGLVQRGAKNKKENILKAYTFIDREQFPSLDTDSCDAVLMAMMGRHASSLFLGRPGDIPRSFLNKLTNSAQITKGKGRNIRTITEGTLHRPEYFQQYKPNQYSVVVKNAKSTARVLERLHFDI